MLKNCKCERNTQVGNVRRVQKHKGNTEKEDNGQVVFTEIFTEQLGYEGGGVSRETREGWTLLTVETEANGDLWNTNERGPSLMVCWSRRAGTRDFCSALAALQSAQYKIVYSSPYTISIPLYPSPGKLDRQPCWVTCLSPVSQCVSLDVTLPPLTFSSEGVWTDI